MWIKRDISDLIASSLSPVEIVQGPRQCGKSSLLLHLSPQFKELSLDDPALRRLAEQDPELFLNQFGNENLLIDEAQYAPNLFPSLKRRVDLFKRSSNSPRVLFRLSGSNQILMDKQVKESLAGRASFFNLNTLTVSEILRSQEKSIQDILFMGGWPELHATSHQNPKSYLDNYITSYVEKDVVLSAGIQKGREFLLFLQLLAGRVGTLLDSASIAKDLGLSGKTVRDWISVLERMGLVALVYPYSANLSKRLIKTPKVYFLDTGLACRLQGWTSKEGILTSPQQGGLFENLVFSEIYKTNLNFGLGWRIYHWRTRDGEEVDFLIESQPGNFLFVEAKTSIQSPPDLRIFPEVIKVFKKSLPPLLLCHMEGAQVVRSLTPIRFLQSEIFKALGVAATAP